MSQEKSLFSKNLEKTLLYFPVLVLLGVLAEMILGPFWPRGGSPSHRWARFLVNVVFLNGIHIIFTYVMIAYLPELQNWARKKSAKIWTYIWTGVAILVSIIAFCGSYFIVEGSYRTLGAHTLFLAAIILPSYHNVWQIRGLALSYRQKESHTNEERQKVIFYDKVLFYLLFAFYCLLLLSMFGWTLPWEYRPNPYWQKLSEAGWPFRVKQLSTIALTLISGCLIWRAIKNPQKNKSHLAWYLIRLLLFPLSSYSYLALMGVLASHGVEYFVVYLSMVKNSKAPEKKKKEIYMMTLSASFFIFVCSVPGLVLPYDNQPTFWILILSALGTAINFMHYYLDRIVFKMRDPMTREIVGPLLIPKN